jgi:hypothetical protein
MSKRGRPQKPNTPLREYWRIQKREWRKKKVEKEKGD